MNPVLTALLREFQADLEHGLDAIRGYHPELTGVSDDDIWGAFWKLHDLAGGKTMTVKITPNDKGNPPGKLADAELHFSEGPLDGLKLIGFAVWERRSGAGRNVTFPARQYSVNGERRSFALLRPVADATAQERVRDLILEAYQQYEGDAARVEG
ncbi:MAG: hypothetical protein ABIK89_19510 [Planctomycetota bacterium]